MNSLDFYNKQSESVGTTGLVLFGDDLALSYTRDDNTASFPNFVDLAGGGREGDESPYETFERELREEFNLAVTPEQIIYTLRAPSMIRPDKVGWFVVAKLDKSATQQVTLGNEGSGYHITPIKTLVNHEKLIPRRKQQIQEYLNYVAILSSRSKS